jgi:hypothetical protein
MLTGLEDSLAVLQLSSPLIALLSVIMFEVPRYLFSSCAMAFSTMRQNIKSIYPHPSA